MSISDLSLRRRFVPASWLQRCQRFEVKAVPVESVRLSAVWVRGTLGTVTVWSTPQPFDAVKTDPKAWTQAPQGRILSRFD